MGNNLGNSVWPEWQIVKEIGRGSFGVVYEAVRTEDQVKSRSAIKVISIPPNDAGVDALRSKGLSVADTKKYFQEVVNEFIREIQIMESLKGVQNIVSVEDYKVVERTQEIGWDIYIRMELLTPFSSYICGRELREKEVVKLGCDICTALEFCAKRGVIHRDIKPANIFVSDFGDFKLGDFGIARQLENITGALSRKGTYDYMAPEVWRGMNYDASVDIYSLGLVLYRIMNRNRLPFIETEWQRRNPGERMKAIERRMDGEYFPAPSDASDNLSQIILCACEPNPHSRFHSATAMKNALLSLYEDLNYDVDDDGKIFEDELSDKDLTTWMELQENSVPDGRRAGNVAAGSGEKENDQSGIRTEARSDRRWIVLAVLLGVLVTGAAACAVPRLATKFADMDILKEMRALAPKPTPTAEPTPTPTPTAEPTPTPTLTVAAAAKTADLKLGNLLIGEGSPLVEYRVCRDGQGLYYENGIGGDAIDKENRFKLYLDFLSEEYRYFQGKVLLNYDLAKDEHPSGYVEIYLDDALAFSSQIKGKDYEPESFCLELTGKQEMEIVIYGANVVRLADAVFSMEKTECRSMERLPEELKNPISDLPVISEGNGLRLLTNARDNQGETYCSVLAGKESDCVNTVTYALDGKYSVFSARAILNYQYRDVYPTKTYIRVDVDGEQKYQTETIQKGMLPEDFTINVAGAQKLTISIEGKNYARLVDVKLR